jgi:hypothetical protein
VAQRGARAARQDGRRGALERNDRSVTNGIDGAMKAM